MKRTSPTRFLQLASQAQFRSWHSVASPQHKPCLAVRAVKVPCRAQHLAISAHATQSRQLTSARPAHAKSTDQERLAGAAIAGTRPLAGVTVVSLEQAIAAAAEVAASVFARWSHEALAFAQRVRAGEDGGPVHH